MSLLSTALREREKKPVSEELHVFANLDELIQVVVL